MHNTPTTTHINSDPPRCYTKNLSDQSDKLTTATTCYASANNADIEVGDIVFDQEKIAQPSSFTASLPYNS